MLVSIFLRWPWSGYVSSNCFESTRIDRELAVRVGTALSLIRVVRVIRAVRVGRRQREVIRDTAIGVIWGKNSTRARGSHADLRCSIHFTLRWETRDVSLQRQRVRHCSVTRTHLQVRIISEGRTQIVSLSKGRNVGKTSIERLFGYWGY